MKNPSHDYYVKNPKSIFPDATCILGDFTYNYEGMITFYGYSWHAEDDPNRFQGDKYDVVLKLPESAVERRGGIPLKYLSGRIGSEYFHNFEKLAASYGYD